MSFGDTTEGFGKKKKEGKKNGIRSKLNKRSGEGRSTGGGNGTVGFSALGGSAPGTGGGGTVDTSLFASKADLAALTAAAATRQELAAEKAAQAAKDAAQDAVAVAEEAKDTTEESTTDTEQAAQDAKITAAEGSIAAISTTVQTQGAAIAALQASSSSGGVSAVSAGPLGAGVLSVDVDGAKNVTVDSPLVRKSGTDRVGIYNAAGNSTVQFTALDSRGIITAMGGTSSGGELRLQEAAANGAHSVIHKAPLSVPNSYTQLMAPSPVPTLRRGMHLSYGSGSNEGAGYWDVGQVERMPPAFNIPEGQSLPPYTETENPAANVTVGPASAMSPQTLQFVSKVPTGVLYAFPRGYTAGIVAINSISPGERYRFGAELKVSISDGATGRVFLAPDFLDTKGRQIEFAHSQYFVESLTTLAAPLNNGDTTMTVASAAGWTRFTTSVSRRVVIGDWVDEAGHHWGPTGYSRVVGESPVSKAGNVITLSAPWTGGNHPVGKAVRQADSAAGSYNYMGWTGQPATEAANWTYKEGVLGHSTALSAEGNGNMGQRIRSGACSMRFRIFCLLDTGQPPATITIGVGAIDFARLDDDATTALDNLSDVDTTGRSAGDTLTWDGTKWKPFMPAPAKVYAEGVGPVGGATSHDVTSFTVPVTGTYRCTIYGEGYQNDTSIQVRKDPSIRTAANGGGTAALSKRIATRIGGMSNGIIALATARGRATLTAGVTYYFHLKHVNEYSDQNCEWSLEMERVV